MLDFERKAFIETMVTMLKSDSNSYPVRVVYFEVDVDTAEYIKHIMHIEEVSDCNYGTLDERIDKAVQKFENNKGYNILPNNRSLILCRKFYTVDQVSYDFVNEIVEHPLKGVSDCRFVRFVDNVEVIDLKQICRC